MIVHIPVYIQIDAQNNGHDKPVSKRVFTLRLDIDKDDVPVEFCNHYMPHAKTTWFPDTGDVLLMALGNDEYKRLVARARANPVDYCADEAEGERLQVIADAAREPNE